MAHELWLLGLCLSLGGALLVALTDAWLSRLLLIYLDAVEANVEKIVEAIRSETTEIAVTGIDLKRDRRLDRARNLKTGGWLALVVGLGLQLAAVYLTSGPNMG
jgi:hypothetical protein